MTGEPKVKPQDQQPNDEQQEADEAPADVLEHEWPCWGGAQCRCGAEEDQHNGRGER